MLPNEVPDWLKNYYETFVSVCGVSPESSESGNGTSDAPGN
jgi:hypothetical protein